MLHLFSGADQKGINAVALQAATPLHWEAAEWKVESCLAIQLQKIVKIRTLGKIQENAEKCIREKMLSCLNAIWTKIAVWESRKSHTFELQNSTKGVLKFEYKSTKQAILSVL